MFRCGACPRASSDCVWLNASEDDPWERLLNVIERRYEVRLLAPLTGTEFREARTSVHLLLLRSIPWFILQLARKGARSIPSDIVSLKLLRTGCKTPVQIS